MWLVESLWDSIDRSLGSDGSIVRQIAVHFKAILPDSQRPRRRRSALPAEFLDVVLEPRRKRTPLNAGDPLDIPLDEQRVDPARFPDS